MTATCIAAKFVDARPSRSYLQNAGMKEGGYSPKDSVGIARGRATRQAQKGTLDGSGHQVRRGADASLALCKRGEKLFIEGATHGVHREEPARINAALAALLRQP